MFKPNFQITAQIAKNLMVIEQSRQSISDAPFSLELLRRLRETALLNSTHFSTQIEGNRLTLPEVEAVKRGEEFPERERDVQEVKNHYKAFDFMEKQAELEKSLEEDEIKTLHGLVLYGKEKPTPYRQQQNVIKDSASGHIVYLPPEAKDVEALMQELVAWVNAHLQTQELPAPIIAGVAHYQFATIHPYLDGNGRTARLLTTLILRRAGYGLKGIYSLDEHYANNLRTYYDCLSVGHSNYYEGRAEADFTPFITYFCEGMAQAFSKIKTEATKSQSESIDQSALLRELDPRQRRLLVLFQQQGSATAFEMAEHLKLKPSTLVILCREWVKSGFLETQNASRKIRSYRLGERYLSL
jgi:Fic family protein